MLTSSACVPRIGSGAPIRIRVHVSIPLSMCTGDFALHAFSVLLMTAHLVLALELDAGGSRRRKNGERPACFGPCLQRFEPGTRMIEFACAENNRNPVDESGRTLTLDREGNILDQL